MRIYCRRRQSGFFAKLKVPGGASIPPINSVRRSQFLVALANFQANAIETLSEAISADRDDLTSLEFNTATYVYPNDLLATKVQSVFGFTNTQMSTIFANAGALPN